MKRYRKCKNAPYRLERDETNDCAVIALSIVGRTNYEVAHKLCKAHGRPLHKGVWPADILKAIVAAGFTYEERKGMKQPDGCNYTAKTVGAVLKEGYWLIDSPSHFFAVVHGDVEDWSKNRKKVVKKAYRIYKTRATK